MGSSKVGHKSIGMEPKAGSCGRPPETSPLSPLPSPSPRPGEGNAVGAVLLVVCCTRIGNGEEKHTTSTTAPAKSPSPGRREGDGRGDRGEVSGGGPLLLQPDLPQPLLQELPRGDRRGLWRGVRTQAPPPGPQAASRAR